MPETNNDLTRGKLEHIGHIKILIVSRALSYHCGTKEELGTTSHNSGAIAGYSPVDGHYDKKK